MEFFKPNSHMSPFNITLVCPHCGTKGNCYPFYHVSGEGHAPVYDVASANLHIIQKKQTENHFDVLVNPNTAIKQHVLGFRVCPDHECGKLVLVSYEYRAKLSLNINTEQEYDLLSVYPMVGVNYDDVKATSKIKSTLIEAATCFHSGCYKATAIMIRRVLEEICHQEEAKGNDLEKRLNALDEKFRFPSEISEIVHSLRFLGNDAAHIQAKYFDEINKDTAEAALTIAEEIVAVIYKRSLKFDALKKKMKKKK